VTATSLDRDIFAGLVEELAIVVGAMIDSTATAASGAPPTGRQWRAEVHVAGTVTGVFTAVLDHEGATAIARLMKGADAKVSDEAILDTLRDVFAQAVSALALQPVARGAKLSLKDVSAGDGQVPDGEGASFAIAAASLPAKVAVTVWGSLSEAAIAAPPSGPPAASPRSPGATADDRIDVILDIDLPLVVRFGRTDMPLRALTRLGPGSVIDLGRSPDDPVELLVSNRVVARGEVVIVGGNYGIRILDVVSQRERVRSMEA